MVWETVITIGLAIGLLGATAWAIDALLAMARRQGRPGRERWGLAILALLGGPLGILVVWWILSRPVPVAPGPA